MTEKTPTLAEQGITQEDINEALHDGARYGELDSLKDLCDSDDTGPYVEWNCIDQSGNTALHKAAANGHYDAIIYLCEKGSDYILNENGIGPISWAIMNQYSKIVEHLISKFSDKIDMLLMPTNGGKSPVALAYDAGDADVVSMVLMHPSAQKLEAMYPNVGLDENEEDVGDETKNTEDAEEEDKEENAVEEVTEQLNNTEL